MALFTFACVSPPTNVGNNRPQASEQCLDWRRSVWPANVTFTDGSVATVGQRERPHVVMGADGYTPVALSTGFVAPGEGGEFGDRTWTMVQPTLWQNE